MTPRTRSPWLVGPLAALVLLQTGCATLVQDSPRVTPPSQAKHCDGSETITSTSMAVLPIPLVAFFTPHVTLNSPDSSAILAKCGGKQQVNRNVRQNFAICVPVYFLTYMVTLGIAGVCPRVVSYESDVVN